MILAAEGGFFATLSQVPEKRFPASSRASWDNQIKSGGFFV
jgi:hypothetical protein